MIDRRTKLLLGAAVALVGFMTAMFAVDIQLQALDVRVERLERIVIMLLPPQPLQEGERR